MRHSGSTGNTTGNTTDGASWSMENIPYDALAYEMVRDDRRLFYIVASASFVEITSDLYARNLVEYFRHDREISEWLESAWHKEDVQHGEALRRYVATASPAFHSDPAYPRFLP